MDYRRRLLMLAIALSVHGAAWAQKPKQWRIGFLSPRFPATPDDPDVYAAFLDGMRKAGYVEGRNVVIEWRYAEGKLDRLPALAEDLVRSKVDVIVTAGTPASHAAQQATSTIPIVIGSATDLVASGFVASLARPGGNITGLSLNVVDVSPKHIELLKDVRPELKQLAVLVNLSHTAHPGTLARVRAAAQRASIKVLALDARDAEGIERAFGSIAREGAQGLIIVADTVFMQQRRQIAELAVRHRVPSVFTDRRFPEAGGLMSYGQSLDENFRRAGTYVDRILKGAKPGELPVEQPMIFYLSVNRATAAKLGLKLPADFLSRANEVFD
jgi:putative tryptophan/tyrosine transport system substrate-binding protein